MDLHTATDQIEAAWQNDYRYATDLTDWLDVDRALHVQCELLERRIARGEHHLGWKIGLTSERVRLKLGTKIQPFGHITRVLTDGASISLRDPGIDTSIEPELIVTLGQDLDGPEVSADQARAACSHIAAGFEINQNRVALDASFPLLIADNLTQWAIVSGIPVALDEVFKSDQLRVRLTRDGVVTTDVIGTPDVIDDHFRSVAVLASTLAQYGQQLKAGQRVITGSFCRENVEAGERWMAEFYGVGTVSASFVD